MATIKQGTAFSVRSSGRVDTFRREENDSYPMFECERIRVTHLTCSDDVKLKPYTFGTEPEWFIQRGHVAGE